MSLAVVASALTAVSALAGIAGMSRQASAQREAQRRAKEAEDLRQQEFNRLNQRKPNISALLAANQNAGRMGAYGTMLTGIGGVQPSGSNLGQPGLLGF